MKKILLTFLIFCNLSFANHFSKDAFIGIKNSKYGFVGYEFSNGFGLALTHSLWVQDASQYIQISPFYTFTLHETVSGAYSIFYGTTYENGFYCYGSLLTLRLNWLQNLLSIEMTLSPKYDSDLGYKSGYELKGVIEFFSQLAIYTGFRNIPEYRMFEKRAFGGLRFSVNNLSVSPEFSIPFNQKTEYTRLHINFIYGF